MNSESESSLDDQLRRLDEIARAERRRYYRETTMAQRLDEALELSQLARDLRDGMLKAQ